MNALEGSHLFGGDVVVEVWPGETAFPDFTNPESAEWWTNMAGAYHEVVPFDGMWIVSRASN